MSLEASPHRRVYTKTTAQDNAHAILGDSHTHHHYYGALSLPRTSADDLNASYATSNNTQVATYRREISLDLISDYDAGLAHWLRKEARLPDTCDWIYNVPEYKKWGSGVGPPVLVCTGSVGCGKSVTASAVLDVLHDDARQNDSVVLSYYIDSLSADKLSVDDILRAIIEQLVIVRRNTNCMTGTDLEDKLRVLLAEPISVPNLSILLQLVKDLAPQNRQTSLLLDGVDAMTEDAIIRLIKVIRDLSESSPNRNPGFRIVVFCREFLGRGIRLEDERKYQIFQIMLKHVQRDIHTFVDQQVLIKQDERCLVQSKELLDEIVRVLKANGAKMFLWVKLQVATIWNPDFSTSEADIRQQLQHLPEGLDQIYTQCLRRIEATHQRRSSMIALKTFRWIATAARPLKQTEARELVSMESGSYAPAPEDALSLPVTDYCSNLVVINHLSGCLEFAHTTVRDFLSDSTKLPRDLHRYLLKIPDTDLWCAYVLLPYIHQHRSRDQLVKVKEHKIPAKVTRPVLTTVFNTLIPNQRGRSSIIPLPGTSAASKNSDHITLATAANTKHQSWRSGQLEVHDYIREYWLSHTKAVPPATNPFFEDLCLSQDPDFLPWATSDATLTEKLSLAVVYAVTTNHVPLFHIIWEHMARKGLQEIIRKNPCPGTQSSYLHIAAALGHAHIAKALVLRRFGGFADADGKSAAAIALEAGQLSVFVDLIATLDYCQTPYRQRVVKAERRFVHVMIDWHGHELTENILLRAARQNDVGAFNAIMHNRWCQDEYLSHAVFHACEYGSLDFARALIKEGANPYHVYDKLENGQLALEERRSSLWQAVTLQKPDLLANLICIGASPTWASPPFDISDIVEYWRRHGDISEAGPSVKLFVKQLASGARSNNSSSSSVRKPATPKILFPRNVADLILSHLDTPSRERTRPYLGYLSDIWTKEHDFTRFTISSSIYRTPWLEGIATSDYFSPQAFLLSQCLRLLLDALPDRISSFDRSFKRSPYIWHCLKRSIRIRPSLKRFLSYATDDVIVPILRQQLLNPDYIFTDGALYHLSMRSTSRALRALADTYIFGRCFQPRDCIAYLDIISRPGNQYVRCVPQHDRLLPWNDVVWVRRMVRLRQYSSPLYTIPLHGSGKTLPDLQLQRIKSGLMHINGMEFDSIGDKFSAVRCLARTGDLQQAQQLHQKMKACNSDADFALNYPAGYALRTNPLGPRDRLVLRYVISSRITHAVYAWRYIGSMIAKHFSKIITKDFFDRASQSGLTLVRS